MTKQTFAGAALGALVAAVLVPTIIPAVQASDLTAQGCSLLRQAADARADEELAGIRDALLDWRFSHRVEVRTILGFDGMSPRKLPAVARKFGATVPRRDFELARLIVDLQKKGQVPSELAGASHYELDASMRDLTEKFNWHQGQSLHVTSMHWDPDGLQEIICGQRAYLEHHGELYVCAVMHFDSSETTYEIDEKGSPGVVVNLYTTTPRQAAHDSWTIARIRDQLRGRERAQLPGECQTAADGHAGQLAEGEARSLKSIAADGAAERSRAVRPSQQQAPAE